MCKSLPLGWMSCLLSFLALLAGVGRLPAATTYDPSTAISLDFHAMNPPMASPAVQNDGIRIEERIAHVSALPRQPVTWQWQLRAPFPAVGYSSLVIRYRATGLEMPPQDAVLRVESAIGNGGSVTLPVFTAADLVQDGRLRELRKELAPQPDGAMIDAILLTTAGAASGGALDIFDLTFETGAHPPLAIASRTQEFAVTDSAGRPVVGAEVHYGLLERSNWVAVGRTDTAGKVTLAAAFAKDGIALPAEATAEKTGYSPQYIAPIDPNNTLALNVKLAPTSEPVGGARPANMPPPAQQIAPAAPAAPPDYYEPPSQYAEPYESSSYPSYPTYPSYGLYGHYGYGWPAGYVWYVVVTPSNNNHDHHRHDHADCRPHSDFVKPNQVPSPFGRNVPGQTPFAAPVRATPPSSPAPSAPSGNAPIKFSDRDRTIITAPSVGVITAPSTGVDTSPHARVSTATPTPRPTHFSAPAQRPWQQMGPVHAPSPAAPAVHASASSAGAVHLAPVRASASPMPGARAAR